MGLSRRTFNEQKRYETVVIKENTTPADFELVELQDIQNAEREGLARELIVDGAIGAGFRVVGAGLSNAVQVMSGSYFAEGKRLILPDRLHQLVGGVHVFNMQIATPVTNRTDLIYADIYTETVTATQDPEIADPAIGITADRERLRYTFKVAEGSTTVPSLPTGHVGKKLALVTRRASDPLVNAADVEDARDAASLNDQFKSRHTLVVSPQGGDFTDPLAALNSIASSSALDPWTILVYPGTYVIDAALNFTQPYVSMVGVDPDSCTILVNAVGNQAVNVNADHIDIRNLSIGFSSGTGTHDATVKNNGVYDLVLENLVLSKAYYEENTTNAFHGINLVSSGATVIRNCGVYAQATSGTAAIVVGSGTVTIDSCEVFAANSDALDNTGGGTLTVRDSVFHGSRSLLRSNSILRAYDSRWTLEALKGFATGTVYPMIFTGAVENSMSDCHVEAGDNPCTMQDTVAWWNNVRFKGQLIVSGGPSSGTGSMFQNVDFQSGVAVNGTVVNLVNCVFTVISSWPTIGGGAKAIVLYGGTKARVIGCRSSGAGNIARVVAANPWFEGCHFEGNLDATHVFDIIGAASPTIKHCVLELTVAYTGTSSGIYLDSNTGSLTLLHSHIQGNPAGQPTYFVDALMATTPVKVGHNTGTAGALASANITKTSIELS